MHTKYSGTQVAGVIVMAVGLLLGGCDKLTPDGAKSSSPPPSLPPPEVGVITVATESLPILTELPGRTVPYQIAEVRPQVGGIIQKRLFDEGSHIKEGETLYQIDPAPYQAAYNSARAALAKAQANLGVTRQKAARYKELVAIHAVSSQDYDDIVAGVKQSEADVMGAQAALDIARINLDYTKVTSPISGRIGKSVVTPGALVTANQPLALATVQQLDPVYVDVTQSSSELMRLRRDLEKGVLQNAGPAGARVALIFEDSSEYSLAGILKFSDVTVDPSTGAVTLRAEFPNPKNELLPGMYVRAVLREAVNNQAILVPQQGITRNNKGEPMALLLNSEGVVEQRVLTATRTVGDKLLVTAGLKAGERVIVEGLQRVKPGGNATAATPTTEAQSMNGMDIMSGMAGINVHSSKVTKGIPQVLLDDDEPGLLEPQVADTMPPADAGTAR